MKEKNETEIEEQYGIGSLMSLHFYNANRTGEDNQCKINSSLSMSHFDRREISELIRSKVFEKFECQVSVLLLSFLSGGFQFHQR